MRRLRMLSGLKADLSFSERQEAVTTAIRKRIGSQDLYVVELYDDRAVYQRYGDEAGAAAGKTFELAYRITDDGTVELAEEATEVQRRTTYTAVKFAKGSDTIVEGYGIPFGGPIKGKDVDGEAFSAETDLCLDWFPSGRPVLYHHGLHGAVKTEVVGRQVDVEIDDDGAFVKVELDKRNRWYSRVKKLIDAGALGFSSGAMPHLVKTASDGTIKRWPWVELSLTPTPANPGAVAYAVKAVDDAFTTDEGSGPDDGPYADHGERVLADVGRFLERTDDRAESRLKVGRELSAANRTALAELDGHLAEWAKAIGKKRDQIRELLERTDPDAKKASSIDELDAELLVGELRRAGRID